MTVNSLQELGFSPPHSRSTMDSGLMVCSLAVISYCFWQWFSIQCTPWLCLWCYQPIDQVTRAEWEPWTGRKAIAIKANGWKTKCTAVASTSERTKALMTVIGSMECAMGGLSPVHSPSIATSLPFPLSVCVSLCGLHHFAVELRPSLMARSSSGDTHATNGMGGGPWKTCESGYVLNPSADVWRKNVHIGIDISIDFGFDFDFWCVCVCLCLCLCGFGFQFNAVQNWPCARRRVGEWEVETMGYKTETWCAGHSKRLARDQPGSRLGNAGMT